MVSWSSFDSFNLSEGDVIEDEKTSLNENWLFGKDDQKDNEQTVMVEFEGVCAQSRDGKKPGGINKIQEVYENGKSRYMGEQHTLQ